MSPLIAAELLRLRTVRAPLYGTLGLLVVLALFGAAPLLDSHGTLTADDLRSSTNSLVASLMFSIGIVSATNVGGEFKRGTTAMTYLVHPDRGRVAVAGVIVWAGLCAALVAVAASLVVALQMRAASVHHVDLGLSSMETARLIAGAAFVGAVMGAAGVLAATVTREPLFSAGAIVGLNVIDTIASNAVHGIRPYLPLDLVGSIAGVDHGLRGFPAMGLLLAYLAVLALAVRVWALRRDLT
jgi:hypothetical protein